MTPGFSMMGSGIYSTTITREIVCKESCEDCEQEGKECDAVWKEDFETDDRGNVDQSVQCKKCNHSLNYVEEKQQKCVQQIIMSLCYKLLKMDL